MPTGTVGVSGVVATFDERRGLGTISADGAVYPFHCTQIIDGTRQVRIGQAVAFDVAPGRRGDWEAVHVEKSGVRTAPPPDGRSAPGAGRTQSGAED